MANLSKTAKTHVYTSYAKKSIYHQDSSYVSRYSVALTTMCLWSIMLYPVYPSELILQDSFQILSFCLKAALIDPKPKQNPPSYVACSLSILRVLLLYHLRHCAHGYRLFLSPDVSFLRTNCVSLSSPAMITFTFI